MGESIRPPYGPWCDDHEGPYVDPAAAQARLELQNALQAAFPQRSKPSASQPPAVSPPGPNAAATASAQDGGSTGAAETGDFQMPLQPSNKKKEDKVREGLEKMTYLSKQPADTRVAWSFQKAHQLHKEGNDFYGRGEYRAAEAKYRSAVDLIGSREDCPEVARCTHDDLTVLCLANLAACFLKMEKASEALRLCDRVLTLDPEHTKVQFRRLTALIRRGPAGADSATRGEPCDEAPDPIFCDPAQPRSGKSALRNRQCERAMELLEVQERLESLCRRRPRDRAVRELVEELYTCAKAESVRLRPPSWLLPKGWRDFDYCHGQTSGNVHTSASTNPARVPQDARTSSALGRSGPGRERNLLVCLHGFGGRKDAFSILAGGLMPPETALIAFNAPHDLPRELFDDPPGYSWFDMLDSNLDFIKASAAEKRRSASLAQTRSGLADVLTTLTSSMGWATTEIFLFGYGQGGTVALDLLLERASSSLHQLCAGVVGIATEVLPERILQDSSTYARRADSVYLAGSPAVGVLLIHGVKDSQTNVSAAETSAAYIQKILAAGAAEVQLRIFEDRGGEILRGAHRGEMMCFMEFLSNHLQGSERKENAEAIRGLELEEGDIAHHGIDSGDAEEGGVSDCAKKLPQMVEDI